MRAILTTLLIFSFCSLLLSPAQAENYSNYSGLKNKAVGRNSKFKKFSYSKSEFIKQHAKRSKDPILNQAITIQDASSSNSNLRPSRAYKTNGAIDAQVCGGEGIFDSYAAYLDCADLAVVQCTSSDRYEKAFCIYQRCGNTPDNFEGLWRDLDAENKSTSVQYYKTNFGSSAFGSDSFAVSLHPCLIDGAGRFYTTSNASALVMGKPFSLGNADLQLFHPAKSVNRNLSSGRVRLGFNGTYLVTINRDDFGDSTVPFTFKQEVFKSFPKTAEDPSRVYWVDKVIPVNMVFRPQGVVGVEIEARVSPEARVLEVNFSAYNDFGTSADAGAAREGVTNNTSTGVISLIQSEYRTNKFISMNAADTDMLPSITELSQLEFWPAKGAFKPICAQWFASATTHPAYGYRCSDLVDFGALNTRKGLVRTGRDGSDRIIYYNDDSQGGDEPSKVPFPFRNPILDDF